MSNTRDCPFCAKPAETIPDDDYDKNIVFKCLNCGMFRISKTGLSLLNEKFVELKPDLLGFVKASPPDKIAFIGYKISPNGSGNVLHWEYQRRGR
jgi:hypothetical protein